jgi:nucleoside-diphosphate-sugar epimerase
VKRLLFLGSSCIYPRLAEQPIREEYLLNGKLEPTNEPYAIAKIAGLKLCESYNRQYGATHGIDYRSVMPTNLYGPGDNYHLENSHVVPALIQRFHLAKLGNAPSVLIWGSGRARREFLYVDDMVEGCIEVMNLSRAEYDRQTDAMRGHINLGTGVDVSIAELTELICEVVGYRQHPLRPGTARRRTAQAARRLARRQPRLARDGAAGRRASPHLRRLPERRTSLRPCPGGRPCLSAHSSPASPARTARTWPNC